MYFEFTLSSHDYFFTVKPDQKVLSHWLVFKKDTQGADIQSRLDEIQKRFNQ